jgi:uncharacterized membrane protein
MNWIDILTLVVALGAALMAGAFFAFSNFIMSALARQPAEAGAAAMQAINVTVLNPLFLAIFMGTAALGVVLIIAVLVTGAPGAIYASVGALLYIVGTFGVTMTRNVPLNNALERTRGSAAAEYWARFQPEWVRWNTVRTVAALFATASLILAVAT